MEPFPRGGTWRGPPRAGGLSARIDVAALEESDRGAYIAAADHAPGARAAVPRDVWLQVREFCKNATPGQTLGLREGLRSHARRVIHAHAARHGFDSRTLGGALKPRVVLRRPQKTNTVASEEISYSVVIESAARRGHAKAAVGWLEHMAASAFKPSVFVFNAVIASFARKGSASDAIHWLGKMVAQGLKPNTVSYTAVIDGCAKAGRSSDAARWFERMVESSVAPSTVTYNAVINACARKGDVEGATWWLEQMRSAGPQVAPDVVSYSSAIHSCATVQPPNPAEAERLFHEMRHQGFHPSISTLTALERAVGRARRQVLCSHLQVSEVQALRERPKHRHRWVRPLPRGDAS